MLWISRNEPLKTASKRLDEHVRDPAFRNMAVVLLLNVSGPQILRCFCVAKRPQHWPFDPDFGEELLLGEPHHPQRPELAPHM